MSLSVIANRASPDSIERVAMRPEDKIAGFNWVEWPEQGVWVVRGPALLPTPDQMAVATAQFERDLAERQAADAISAIDRARRDAKTAIDAAAEQQRLRVITPGAGQALVYQAKLEEARACVADAAPAETAYPLLAAEVGITAADLAAVAAAIIATAAQWHQAAAAIETVRLAAKRAVDSAADPAAVQAVLVAITWPEL